MSHPRVDPHGGDPAGHEDSLDGLALAERGSRGELLVEREGRPPEPTNFRWWLREPGATAPADLAALEVIGNGPVLDLGCSTGRHLELLAERGIDGDGIDVLAPAVREAVAHGCRAQLADLWTFRPRHHYRHLLLMGNNLGLARRLPRLPLLLDRLGELLVPGGSVLLSGRDWRPQGGRPEPWTAGAADAYPGNLRLRHRYAGLVGPWFEWLDADPDTLTSWAAASGFGTRVMPLTSLGPAGNGFFCAELTALSRTAPRT